MKSSIFLFTLALAFLQGTAARTLPRNQPSFSPRADCETSDFICTHIQFLVLVKTLADGVHIACIVSLAELPLQITTCLEAVDDINKLFDDLDNNQSKHYGLMGGPHHMLMTLQRT